MTTLISEMTIPKPRREPANGPCDALGFCNERAHGHVRVLAPGHRLVDQLAGSDVGQLQAGGAGVEA